MSAFPGSPLSGGHSGPPSPGGSSSGSQSPSPAPSESLTLSDDVTITKNLSVAGSRWLKSHEIQDILINYASYGLQLRDSAPTRPMSGSVFLYDKRRCRKWRTDGHQWSAPERHVKLKVGGKPVVNALYSHALSEAGFHRRGYWLLDNKEIVLVHYLNQDKVRTPSRAALSPLSVGSTQDVGLSQLSLKGGTTPVMKPSQAPSRSPKVVGDAGGRKASVIIERPTKVKTENVLETQSRSIIAARGALHSQVHSSDSSPSRSASNSSGWVSSEAPQSIAATFPAGGLAQSLTSIASSSPASSAPGASSIVAGRFASVFSTGSNAAAVAVAPRNAIISSMMMNNRANAAANAQQTDGTPANAASSAAPPAFRPANFTNSPTLATATGPPTNNGNFQFGGASSVPLTAVPIPAPTPALSVKSSGSGAKGQSQSHATAAASASPIQPLILDYSPTWDYRDGGTKMLIVVSNAHLFRSPQLYCVFDTIRMSMHEVSPGVYRVQVPAFAIAGVIPLYITDLYMRTKREPFEYRIKETESRRNSGFESNYMPSFTGGSNGQAPLGNPQEREFLHHLFLRLTELDSLVYARSGRSGTPMHSDSISGPGAGFQSPNPLHFKPFTATPIGSERPSLVSPSVERSASFTSPDSADVDRYLASGYRNSNSAQPMKLSSNSPSPNPSPRTSNAGITAALLSAIQTPASQVSQQTRFSLWDIQRLAFEHSCDDLMEGIVLHILREGRDANALSPAFIKHSDSRGRQLLHYVAALGFTHVVQLLMNCHADVNCRDQSGRTPLHYAALAGDGNMVSALLSFGADDSIQDSNRCTALALADQSGSGSVVDVFLDVQTAEQPTSHEFGEFGDLIVQGEDGKAAAADHAHESELNLGVSFSSITFADMGINTSELESSEGATDEKFAVIVKHVQRKIRWWLYRRHMAAQKLQAATRGMLVRRNVKRIRDAAKTIQSLVRTRRARRDFQAMQHAARTIQTKFRSSRSSATMAHDDAMNRSRSNSRGPPIDSHHDHDWNDPAGYLAQQASAHLNLHDANASDPALSSTLLRDASRQSSVSGELRRSSGSSRDSGSRPQDGKLGSEDYFDALPDFGPPFGRHSTSSNAGVNAFGGLESRTSMSLTGPGGSLFPQRDSLSDHLPHEDDLANSMPGLGGIGSLMAIHSLPRTPPTDDAHHHAMSENL